MSARDKSRPERLRREIDQLVDDCLAKSGGPLFAAARKYLTSALDALVAAAPRCETCGHFEAAHEQIWDPEADPKPRYFGFCHQCDREAKKYPSTHHDFTAAVLPPPQADTPRPRASKAIADQTLAYERVDDKVLMSAITLFEGERLLVLRPFSWHIDGSHIPNAAEQFSREGVCADHDWEVVCEYGPYIAVVRGADTPRQEKP